MIRIETLRVLLVDVHTVIGVAAVAGIVVGIAAVIGMIVVVVVGVVVAVAGVIAGVVIAAVPCSVAVIGSAVIYHGRSVPAAAPCAVSPTAASSGHHRSHSYADSEANQTCSHHIARGRRRDIRRDHI